MYITATNHHDPDSVLLVINRPDGLPEIPYDDVMLVAMASSNDWDNDYDGGQMASDDEFQGLTIVTEDDLIHNGGFHHEY